MKKIVILLLFTCALNSYSQITLEHVYDSAATWTQLKNQLIFVEFDNYERYIRIDKTNRIMTFFDENHNFISTLSLAAFPDLSTSPDNFSIIYISDKLFNVDDKIEFMYVSSQMYSAYTGIYNEDGVLLFSVYNEAPWVQPSWHHQQYPIFNTSTGTKLIMSTNDNKAKVYSLPGTLSSNIEIDNSQLLDNYYHLFAFPNPSFNQTTIEFDLPPGNKNGEIVFYTLHGQEIMRYMITNDMQYINVNTSNLSAGTYYYQIQCPDGYIKGEKLTIIK